MSGYSLSAGRTNSWPSGRIPDIEKLHCTVGLPSDHGRVRTFCQPDYRSHKMDRHIRGSKWPSRQGTRRRDLPSHLNETSFPFALPTSAEFAALPESDFWHRFCACRAKRAYDERRRFIRTCPSPNDAAAVGESKAPQGIHAKAAR